MGPSSVTRPGTSTDVGAEPHDGTEPPGEPTDHSAGYPGTAAGWLWDGIESEFISGWVSWDELGIVTASGRGAPPTSTPVSVWGVILPCLVNYHTHLGDRAFRTRLQEEGAPLDIASVVGPGGLKHRWLADSGRKELIEGMARGIDEVAREGCDTFVDFREGGVEGVDLLHEALGSPTPEDVADVRPTPVILGRPYSLGSSLEASSEALLEASTRELRELVASCDGLGLSALRDLPEGLPLEWAAEAHRANKLVALHASEAVREPMDRIMELKPHLLVHLGAATREDLELIARQGTAVALCPSSNLRFGLRPASAPILMELGIPVGLGTDNSMLGPASLLNELRSAARLWPVLREKGLMELLVGPAPKWLNKEPGYPFMVAKPARLTVWNGSGSRPLDKLLAPDCRCRLTVAYKGGIEPCGSNR